MLKKIYFTITGMHFFEGDEFIEPGMEVMLEKEPDNKYDNEAILVKLPGVATIGHVARIYDKIGNTAYGKVMYKMDRGVVCELIETNDK